LYLGSYWKAQLEVLMVEEKGSKVKDKGQTEKEMVRKQGLFARFLERLAKENEKSGGQICGA
jgi:hypothetical protein